MGYMMSLLEKGMQAARNEITDAAFRMNAREFEGADHLLGEAIANLIMAVKRHKDFDSELNDVMSAITNFSAISIWAGFRIGVTEGLKLANEVRSILNSQGLGG